MTAGLRTPVVLFTRAFRMYCRCVPAVVVPFFVLDEIVALGSRTPDDGSPAVVVG